jgi:hypothetical protein
MMNLGPEEPMPLLVLTHPDGKYACRVAGKRAHFTVEAALSSLILGQLRSIIEERESFPLRVYRCTGGTLPDDVVRHYHLTSQTYRWPCSVALRSPLFVAEATFDWHDPVEL